MLADLIAAGRANPVFLAMLALALGGLHGLEPGHSKTMMAAYIVAVRGTVGQGVLLGLSAALSHSLIVWVLAALALIYGDELIGLRLEPWFMMASGAVIAAIGVRLLFVARRRRRHEAAHHHHHHHDDHHHHGHDGLDAHARAHAREVEARIGPGGASTWQTVLFGLSGGLVPCPAAITVLLLCLNLGQVWLGVTLVTAFSAGLALTLIAVGVAAAVGLKALSARTSRLDGIFAAAPWLSGALIVAVGLAFMALGWVHPAG